MAYEIVESNDVKIALLFEFHDYDSKNETNNG